MSQEVSSLHAPVMAERCVALIQPALSKPGAVFVDATLGMGGHSEAVLEACPEARLIGLDRDTQALELAGERLARFGDRVTLAHTVFDGLASVLDQMDVEHCDAVLFDLGVSSLQLDSVERGFAYAQDAPLDMRMDQTSGETAADLIATLSEVELRDLFYRFGDEPLAPRYASWIVREREEAPITTTGQLTDLLQRATPAAKRNLRHPAKRVFQALRVRVNGELEALASALPIALERVSLGGRVVVESYQSHEDRYIKRLFQDVTTSQVPRGLPMVPEELKPAFTALTRGAERASETEMIRNPRSKPVRLRAVERIRTPQ